MRDLCWTTWHCDRFSPSTWFPLPILVPSNAPYSCINWDGTTGQLVAELPNGLNLTPPPRNRVILQKRIFAQIVKIFAAYSVTQNSWQYLQESIICSYPESGDPQGHFNFHLNVALRPLPRSPIWSLLFMYTDWNVDCISHRSHACYMMILSHPPQFGNFTTVLNQVQKDEMGGVCSTNGGEEESI
jgi:hypothetical protein